jgi:hypothetical protein
MTKKFQESFQKEDYHDSDEIILYDGDPDCDHEIYDNFYGGGGIKCKKCRGWFCY